MELLKKIKEIYKIILPYRRYIIGIIGFLVSFPFVFFPLKEEYPLSGRMFSIVFMMGIYWMFEVFPLAVTGMIPLVLYPLYGILDDDETASSYTNDAISLFFGGFVIATGMERWGLHERLALRLLIMSGKQPIILIGGFMFATGFLSMWISNTATTALITPIVISLLGSIEYNLKKSQYELNNMIQSEENNENDNHNIVIDGEDRNDGEIVLSISDNKESSSDSIVNGKISDNNYGTIGEFNNENLTIEEESDEEDHNHDVYDNEENKYDNIELDEEMKQLYHRFSIIILLSVAYSSSIAGSTSLIGTAPNLVLISDIKILFPLAPELSFLNWIIFALPLGAFFIFFIWFYFVFFYGCQFRKENCFCFEFNSKNINNSSSYDDDDDDNLSSKFKKKKPVIKLDISIFQKRLNEIGKIKQEEILVSFLLIIMIILWFTRKGFGVSWFSGWLDYLPMVGYGTIAIGISILLFILPSKSSHYKSPLLSWADLIKFPWGILLLLGSGFALADGFAASGLSLLISELLEVIDIFPLIITMFCISLISIFTTEITSNLAISSIFIPIVAELAIKLGQNPLLFMIPTAISCSYAFLFPIATPPNAIVFASGYIKIRDMASNGLLFNITGSILITIYTYFVSPFLFDITLGEVPTWANNTIIEEYNY